MGFIRVHKTMPDDYIPDRDDDGMLLENTEIFINVDHIMSVEHGEKYFIESTIGPVSRFDEELKKKRHWQCKSLIRLTGVAKPIKINEPVHIVNALIDNLMSNMFPVSDSQWQWKNGLTADHR